jgi:hypothetical protein
MKEKKRETFGHFCFACGANEAESGATAENGGVSMHRDDFLELSEMVGVAGRNKGQRKRWRAAQFGAHFFRDGAHTRLVERVQDKAGNGAIHGGEP